MQSHVMPTKTKAQDRLSILRNADHFREWRTLADERVCVLDAKEHVVRSIQTV